MWSPNQTSRLVRVLVLPGASQEAMRARSRSSTPVADEPPNFSTCACHPGGGMARPMPGRLAPAPRPAGAIADQDLQIHNGIAKDGWRDRWRGWRRHRRRLAPSPRAAGAVAAEAGWPRSPITDKGSGLKWRTRTLHPARRASEARERPGQSTPLVISQLNPSLNGHGRTRRPRTLGSWLRAEAFASNQSLSTLQLIQPLV